MLFVRKRIWLSTSILMSPRKDSHGNVLAASCRGIFNRRRYHKLSLDSSLQDQSARGQAVNKEAMVNPTFGTHVRIELSLSSDTSHMIRDSDCDNNKQKQCSRRRSKKKPTASGRPAKLLKVFTYEHRTVSYLYRRC